MAMSLSVSGSNTTNPFANLQALWQQTTSGAQSQSDPLSGLLSLLDQQGAATASTGTAAGGTTTSAASGTTSGTGSVSPQFGSQMLQTLLALQGNGSNAQSLAAQFEDGADNDPSSALQGQSSQSSQGGHHHHHHLNPNASDSNTNSATGTANSSSGSGTGSNLLSQLMQMQAQLVAPPAQSIATA
jgi:hypothetical protein